MEVKRRRVVKRGSRASTHFFARARERWGFVPTRRERHAMLVAWATGEALHESGDIYWIELRSVIRRVVIRAGWLITALPEIDTRLVG